jgi:hypothetical protein
MIEKGMEVVMACFRVLFKHLPARSDGHNRNFICDNWSLNQSSNSVFPEYETIFLPLHHKIQFTDYMV